MAKKRRFFHRSKIVGYPPHERADLDHPLVALAGIIGWATIEHIVPTPDVAGP